MIIDFKNKTKDELIQILKSIEKEADYYKKLLKENKILK